MIDRALRLTLSVIVVAAGAVLLHNLAIAPYRCNLAEKRLQAMVMNAMSQPEHLSREQARDILERVDTLRRRCPTATNLHMVAAAAHRILGEWDEAISAYHEALLWDRRPEIYYNLGMTLLTAGRRDEAIPVLVHAASFDRHVVWKIGDPAVADRVYQLVRRTHDPTI